MKSTIVIAVIALLGFSYVAYLEHVSYLVHGDPSKYTQERARRISQAVASSLREQRECIEKDPSKWCDRDMSRERLIAHHSMLYDKFNFTDGPDGPRQARNRYMLYAFIAGVFLLYKSVTKLKDVRNATDDTNQGNS